MTHLVCEKEPDTACRPPAEAVGPSTARRRRSPLWEFLGMAVPASALCLAVVSPDLREAVVHILASTAVELTR
ncbi:hypothetical protein ABT084_24855 [Streptomyces sp. NPDC002138]|uniref:hypothetical protein n=1 Tax=Streptomyces sp. NPDC002138 TaxID=3154410 RepID=UPI0033190DF3